MEVVCNEFCVFKNYIIGQGLLYLMNTLDYKTIECEIFKKKTYIKFYIHS